MENINLKKPAIKVIKDRQEQTSEREGVKFQLTTSSQTPRYLSKGEACKILRISSRTMQNYLSAKRISFYQVGRKLFFTYKDIDEFLERHHIRANYQKGGAA
ncbi:MAG: helix-turn-helix domain-containing protein [Bacteroidales bacterium]|nr:helix-turn-helix domain-containing protein [Bacteroidales bacterium]